jgi:hypothetical protein
MSPNIIRSSRFLKELVAHVKSSKLRSNHKRAEQPQLLGTGFLPGLSPHHNHVVCFQPSAILDFQRDITHPPLSEYIAIFSSFLSKYPQQDGCSVQSTLTSFAAEQPLINKSESPVPGTTDFQNAN